MARKETRETAKPSHSRAESAIWQEKAARFVRVLEKTPETLKDIERNRLSNFYDWIEYCIQGGDPMKRLFQMYEAHLSLMDAVEDAKVALESLAGCGRFLEHIISRGAAVKGTFGSGRGTVI